MRDVNSINLSLNQKVSFGEKVIYIILAAAAGAVAILWFSIGPDYASSAPVPRAWNTLASQCHRADGTWLREYRECEDASPEWCNQVGGHFLECESACRHDDTELGGVQPCTMQCIPVCRLEVSVSALGPGPVNAEYTVEGEPIRLLRGYYGRIAEDGTRYRIRVFEAMTSGDLNGDGYEDAVVILVREINEERSRFYVATAMQDESGRFEGTNAVLIGDYVSPQSNRITDDGVIEVGYSDRYPWEEITARPTVGKTKQLRVSGHVLGELPDLVIPDGEARRLAVSLWGDCSNDACGEMTVRVLDGSDGVWYVEATFIGVRDDSVRSVRKIASVHNIDGAWQIGAERSVRQSCQPGRGHEEFSTDLCL